MEQSALRAELAEYTGTFGYAKTSPFCKNVVTDGVLHMVLKCEAFWLIDVINSHLDGVSQPFASTTITKTGDKAKVVMTDGNDGVLAEQNIPYTDFPFDEFEIWSEHDGHRYVHLLPSEH